MQTSEIYLKGRQGSYLHVMLFNPEKAVNGVVHILHGMGEHAARYSDFATYLSKAGYAVCAHDHRGHGQSITPAQEVGILSKSDTFNAMIADVDIVQQYIKSVYKKTAQFMLGHSMGSIILRRYLELYNPEINGAIIMGSLPRYGKLYVKTMRCLAWMLSIFKTTHQPHHLLAHLLNQNLIKTIEHPKTKFDWISKDEAIVKTYNDDPLCGYAYNKHFYKQFFKTIDEVNRLKAVQTTAKIPLLFISGEEDPVHGGVSHIKKLAEFYRQTTNNPVEVNIINDARHEVLNELNKTQSYATILQFIKRYQHE